MPQHSAPLLPRVPRRIVGALAAIAAIGLVVVAAPLLTGDDDGASPRDGVVSAGGEHPEPVPLDGGVDPVAAAVAPLAQPARTSVAWASGGLPDDLAETVRAIDGVERAAVVRAGMLELLRSLDADGAVVEERSDGFTVPLDAFAVDPQGYAALYEGGEPIAALERGQALLSATSAELRGIGAGGRLELDGGGVLEIADVVPDELVGGAEVVVSVVTGADLGLTNPRHLVVVHDGAPRELEAAITTEEAAVRVVPAEGERVLRHGMGVLTQAEVKRGFGEFAIRREGPDREVTQDLAWREANIVRGRVPILGTVRCHRLLIPLVRSVLTEIEEAGLSDTIDPAGYAGCWNARLTNRQDAVSRHSWGIAIDLNFPDNPVGSAGMMHPELVDAFARHGFTWGGTWLLTDPTHFEAVILPEG
jgi:hypothetical protein